MARVLTLSRSIEQRLQTEALRIAVVCGCALSLIAAGQALPV